MAMPDMTSKKKFFRDLSTFCSRFLLPRGKGWHVANRFATRVPPWPACWRAEFQCNNFGLWKGPRVALGHGSNPPIEETRKTEMFQDLDLRFVICGHLSVHLSVHVALYPPSQILRMAGLQSTSISSSAVIAALCSCWHWRLALLLPMDDALDVMIGACEVANAPGHSATFLPRPLETFRDPCATENAAKKKKKKSTKGSEVMGKLEIRIMHCLVLFGNKQ